MGRGGARSEGHGQLCVDVDVDADAYLLSTISHACSAGSKGDRGAGDW